MSGYIITNGKIDINLNASDYFDTVLMNMLFGFISHTYRDLKDNVLTSFPKSVHNLSSIASGEPTIGSLVPFIKNSAITSDLIYNVKLECENALLEIVQNGDISGFNVEIERQNSEIIFNITLNIDEKSLFYSYIYNVLKGSLAIG